MSHIERQFAMLATWAEKQEDGGDLAAEVLRGLWQDIRAILPPEVLASDREEPH